MLNNMLTSIGTLTFGQSLLLSGIGMPSRTLGVSASTSGSLSSLFWAVSWATRLEYGRAPGEINEEVRRQILGDEKPIQGRFADTLAPGFEAAKAETGAFFSPTTAPRTLERMTIITARMASSSSTTSIPMPERSKDWPKVQMVGVQATANVLAGQRYKNVSKEIKSYLRGEYGRAPGEINEEVRRQILGDEKGSAGRSRGTPPGWA